MKAFLNRLGVLLMRFGGLFHSEWAVAIVFSIGLIFAQYLVNSSGRLAAECSSYEMQLLNIKLDRLEALIVHNGMAIDGLKNGVGGDRTTQIAARPDAGAAAQMDQKAEKAYQQLLQEFENAKPLCDGISEFRDENLLLFVAVGAMLTLITVRLGQKKVSLTAKPKKVTRRSSAKKAP